jgi:ferredoxin
VDLTANRFAAVAAGLGDLGWNGLPLTPEYGARQRFIAILTDAPLEPDRLYDGEPLCTECGVCVQACPARAIDPENRVTFTVEDKTFRVGALDPLRCDWAKRYGLLAEEGPKSMGSNVDFPVPDRITPEATCQAIREQDMMQRAPSYTAIIERCYTECPAHKRAATPNP